MYLISSGFFISEPGLMIVSLGTMTGFGSNLVGSGRGGFFGNGLEAFVLEQGQRVLPIIIYLYYYILIAHK
jgi:hypothetical protein